MIDSAWASGEVLHEERRLCRGGMGPLTTFGQLVAMVTLGTAWGVYQQPEFLTPALLTWAGFVAFFAALVLAVAHGRIRVTPLHILVRTRWREQAVPRNEVVHVVHIETLLAKGLVAGYIALLDGQGRPLLRTPTDWWPEETVRVLRACGRELTEVPAGLPCQVEARWPGLLPWRWVHDVLVYRLAFWGTVAVGCAVIGATYRLFG